MRDSKNISTEKKPLEPKAKSNLRQSSLLLAAERYGKFHTILQQHRRNNSKRLLLTKPPIAAKNKLSRHELKEQNNQIPAKEFAEQDKKALVIDNPQKTTSFDVELGIISQTRVSGAVIDDINRLMKKMMMSFSAEKAESSFVMSDGLFEGTSFRLCFQNRDLDIEVKNADQKATMILSDHENYLRSRLLDHEIKLQRMMLF
jgi:hypothetical protein